MQPEARRSNKRLLRVALWALVLLLAFVAYVNRQDLQDRFMAWRFDPSPRLAEVIPSLNLTPAGERVFLASRPTISGSPDFDEYCAGVKHSEEGHVLGCFAGDQIHLFDVTDERVNGIVEVTAAHELLHAAFARLSDAQQTALIEQLQREYDTISEDDPDFVERMSVYSHLPKASFMNELHAVLGTEVRDLSPWLETHYATWLSDRSGLVDKFASYHSVFVELHGKAEGLSSEMSELKTDIEARDDNYDAAVKEFNRDAADLRARNERYEFSSSPDEFDRIRNELSARRETLETTRENLQADVDRYNELRRQLEELSQIGAELAENLNSDLAPVTTRPEA